MSLVPPIARPAGEPTHSKPADGSAPASRSATHAATRAPPAQAGVPGEGAAVPSSSQVQRCTGTIEKGPRQRARCSAGTTSAAGGGGGSGGGSDLIEDDSSSAGSGLQQEADPLYDEAADEEDAVWADQQREGRVSDAVLSCPGCFTTLCIDCQRHEKYHHQYRAMFVMNCAVEAEEGYDPTAGGQAGSGGGGGGGGGRRPKRARGSARYRRVTCGVCGTEVGALEVDEELYHFYHVFPSNA